MSGNESERGKGRGDPSSNAPPAPGPDRHSLAPMDFSTFVMSLGSSAMVHLGQIPSPEGEAEGTSEGPIDLSAAKQIVDILGMLEEKTRGNLDDSETKLLQSILYDLRVAYVDAQKQGA